MCGGSCKGYWRNRLFVKAEKCEFSCVTTSFLGYIISTGNISMDPEKVRAVEQWPKPMDRKALQRFLGFANFYRRFIRNYSSIAAPLTTPHVEQGQVQLGAAGWGSVQRSQGEIHLGSHPSTPRPRETVHCGSGCLQHRGRGHPVAALGWGL